MKTPLERVRLGAFILGLIFAASTVAYRLAGRSWMDALYMVVITVSTVGFSDQSHLPPLEQGITMVVIVLGISAAVFTLGGFLQMMTEGEVERALSATRNVRAIERLQEHVILCGYGRMGSMLAHELRAKQRPFVIVDHSAERLAEAQTLGYLALVGDATDEALLESAGVRRARCLVTVLPNDASNVFIALTSRNLNPRLQIIARGEYPSTQKKLIQAGADRVVLPAAVGAQRIAAMITRPSSIELMELVAGQSVLDVEVNELTIPGKSPLVGKTVADAEARERHGLLMVAVKQRDGGMIFNPRDDLAFQAGDIIIAMGRVENIDHFRQAYGI